jgi:hypothetical protein
MRTDVKKPLLSGFFIIRAEAVSVESSCEKRCSSGPTHLFTHAAPKHKNLKNVLIRVASDGPLCSVDSIGERNTLRRMA